MGNGAQWLVSFYACATLGAVTVPINTRFRSDELGYCLKQADIRCLIFVDRFLGIDFCALLQDIVPTLPQLQCALMLGDGPCPDWAQRLQDSPARDDTTAALAAAVSPDDILLIQYTSGTTSFPKGVMLSHANLYLNGLAAAAAVPRPERGVGMVVAPFFHVGGCGLSLQMMQRGVTQVVIPYFDEVAIFEAMQGEGVTETFLVPSMIKRLIEHPRFGDFRFPRFAVMLYGAAPIDAALLSQAMDALPGAQFDELTVEVPAFARLYFFSDGLYEVTRPDGSMMAYEEFVDILMQAPRTASALTATVDAVRAVRG